MRVRTLIDSQAFTIGHQIMPLRQVRMHLHFFILFLIIIDNCAYVAESFSTLPEQVKTYCGILIVECKTTN
jgi:hypothetical protein